MPKVGKPEEEPRKHPSTKLRTGEMRKARKKECLKLENIENGVLEYWV
jgi:hypothetical protein